jgi:hypothetical protein
MFTTSKIKNGQKFGFLYLTVKVGSHPLGAGGIQIHITEPSIHNFFYCKNCAGDQKCSVSCVEDSLSIPSTRLHLDYGGSDISQVAKHFFQIFDHNSIIFGVFPETNR